MEPFSIIGAVGSTGSIIDLLAKTIVVIDRWFHSYNDAPSEVEQLRRELHMVQCTINMIGNMLLQNSRYANPAIPEPQQPGFARSLLGAQATLQRVFSECSAIESRFKTTVSRKLVWAIADRRRADRLRESLETMQSNLGSFLGVHTLSVLLVAHENSRRDAERARSDMKALIAAVQGDAALSRPEQQVQATPINLQLVRREHIARLLRKVFAASVRWQERYGFSFRLSGSTSADEPSASTYSFLLHLTFPTWFFGDKTLKVALSLGIGTPWYERIDILGGGIRTHNTVPYSAEIVGAARSGNVALLRMLLTRGRASIRDATPDVRPILWHAIDGDSVEAVKYLLDSKADATALAGPYQTELLSRAFYRRNVAISRLLILHGVDLDHVNGSGTTPAHHLFNPGRAGPADSQFLDMLAAGGFCNLNVQDEFGETALHCAAAHGTAADVERLIRLGADYGLRTPERGWTPLFSAVVSDNPDTLRQLVAMAQEREHASPGAVVGDIDTRGWTPLHVAAHNASFRVARELLRMGADPLSLSVPSADARFCDEVKGRRVSPLDLARHKGRHVLEQFERLMRESGRHKTYLDEEGDVFWPACTGNEHSACPIGCWKAHRGCEAGAPVPPA